MNISGIRPYAGFYDYNSIKAEELRSRQIAEAQLTISLQQPEEMCIRDRCIRGKKDVKSIACG